MSLLQNWKPCNKKRIGINVLLLNPATAGYFAGTQTDGGTAFAAMVFVLGIVTTALSEEVL
jgi:hypothetical protein